MGIAVSFQKAYIAAAIDKSGDRQFHMRHLNYSEEVKDILDGIAGKLQLMTKGLCDVASAEEEDGKFEAPKGLVSRLNIISRQLERLLTGPTWHSPFFGDDKLMKEYIATLELVRGLTPDITSAL